MWVGKIPPVKRINRVAPAFDEDGTPSKLDKKALRKMKTMKKLMIVAALATVASSVFADAQVYDVKLKVKTTACKSAKLSKALADLGWWNLKKGDEVAFRGSATRKMAGVIWGCDCDTLSRPSWRVENGGPGVGGYAFWDQTRAPYTPFQIPYVTFNWAVLNRVGKMTNVEGTWILGDTAAGELFYFMGAGFGTCTLNKSNDCASYVKSMTGNFAGFMEYNYTAGDGCIFCGETYSYCLVVPFCVCAGGPARDTRDFTVAYGTWQIKYNSSDSKKLRTKRFITFIRNFKGKKTVDVGVALDAGYDATMFAYNNRNATANDSWGGIKYQPTVGTNLWDIAAKELVTKGKYYTYASLEAAAAKGANVELVIDPGPVSTNKLNNLPAVAGTLIQSLDHVESAAKAADAADEGWGDEDWGDEDWGDDGDDWDF